MNHSLNHYNQPSSRMGIPEAVAEGDLQSSNNILNYSSYQVGGGGGE